MAKCAISRADRSGDCALQIRSFTSIDLSFFGFHKSFVLRIWRTKKQYKNKQLRYLRKSRVKSNLFLCLKTSKNRPLPVNNATPKSRKFTSIFPHKRTFLTIFRRVVGASEQKSKQIRFKLVASLYRR